MKKVLIGAFSYNGKLINEDNIFCSKWRSLGNKVYIDPTMTCNHIGAKKYSGNFMEFIEQLKEGAI